MKKIKTWVIIVTIISLLSSTTVYAKLPGDSILIGNQAYSSDYVAEYTSEINLKIDNTTDNIYYIDVNSNIYNMFNPSISVSESEIAKRNNYQITYYTKDKIQSYIAKDANSPFELQGEYSVGDTYSEAAITTSGMGSYKTIGIKLKNLVGVSEGKYFKLEDKADIKAINGTDSVSIFTSKNTMKIIILANDKKTRLAEGVLNLSSVQSGTVIVKLALVQSSFLDPGTVNIANKPGKSDTVEITQLQTGVIIKVYDGVDKSKLLAKATASSSGKATIGGLNLDSQGGVMYLSLTESGYAEGPLTAKAYGKEEVPPLSSKPSCSDPTGFENNDKTKIKLGSPSIKGNTFKYIMSTSRIETPKINDYATGWSPIANGDLISNAADKYIGVAEVDSNDKIICFTGIETVVVNEGIPKLKNGLKFVDVPGIDNNDKTEIILGEPSVSGNSFVYKISSNSQAVETPQYQELLTEADGWKPVKDGDYISTEKGKHIGIAEIDPYRRVLQFSDATAVINNEDTPSLLYGLSFVDAPGEANNGKTQIILGSPSEVGNTYRYKISNSSAAVPKPGYKENIGTESLGWKAVLPNDYITVANGKHIGVAEVNSKNEVIRFSDSVAVVVNENPATSMTNLVFEYVLDELGNRKVKFNLPEPSYPVNKFKFIVSSDDKPVKTPNIGTSVSSWTTVANGDLHSVEDGKYIGVAEVDSGMKVLRFGNATVSTNPSMVAPPLTGLSFSDAIGSEDNGKTKISLPAPSAGNNYKYIISSNDQPIQAVLIGQNVSNWINVYDGATISTENSKNIGVAEVTADGRAVRFGNGVAVVINESRELTGGVTFKAGTGYEFNSKTQIVLGQPSVSTNKFKYIISSTNAPVPAPAIGSSVSSWTYVKDGDYITVSDGKYIGVAEVDANDKVIAFSNAVSRVLNYAPPLVNSLSLTDVTGITNNNKVIIKLGTPSNVSNHFVYKVFTSSPVENYKVSDTASGFLPIPDNNIISLKYNEYLGVAEVNGSNGIVQFGIVKNTIKDEKIETSVADSQSKMLTGNLLPDTSDLFNVKVTNGTLRMGPLNDSDFTVTGLPSGLNLSATVSSNNTITFKLTGTLSSALTVDTDFVVTLNYSCIIESGLDSSVNSAPFVLTIKKN